MKKIILYLLILLVTISQAKSISPQEKKPIVEVVFVLDTTGSMEGLIGTAKEKIWSIATSLSQSDPAPEIKIGLVAYRDRGDQYITRVVNLNSDIDAVYAKLMEFEARGGGDTLESVNEAIFVALNDIKWSTDKDAYRTIFLVGDQGPHMDYSNDIDYQKSCKIANKKAITINTIQMSTDMSTRKVWIDIAKRVNGKYIQVDSDASGLVINTPYDKEIAELTDTMEDGRMYYGSMKMKKKFHEKAVASRVMKKKLSSSVKARRSSYKFSESGKKNMYGSNELLQDIAEDKVSIDKLNTNILPKAMQKMTKKEQKEYVAKKIAKRDKLKAKILTLQKKRSSYIESKVDEKKVKNSFSYKVYDAIKVQAKEKNIIYKEKVKN